jgi:hypothetical protein
MNIRKRKNAKILAMRSTIGFRRGRISSRLTQSALSAKHFPITTESQPLTIMSANFGVVKKPNYRIKMKNEFRFDGFVPTQLGKHYFTIDPTVVK